MDWRECISCSTPSIASRSPAVTGAVPKPVARAAFRVALLAIDNVVRHANASKVLVRLTVDAAAFDLAIADNGTGFDGDATPRGGRGLVDMRAAATAVGATLTVEAPADGTRITFGRALV
jgi:signal transduction histidine kinase